MALGRFAGFVVGLCFVAACGNAEHPTFVGDEPMGGTGGSSSTGSSGRAGSNNSGSAGKPSKTSSLREGGFINIPSVSDILYDAGRDVLYVSTTEGALTTVDLDTGEFSGQKIGDGPLTGIDLSPSGRYLAIAENTVDKEAKQYWVHILDLETSTLREIYFPQTFFVQEGALSVAFLDDQNLLLTSNFTAGGFVPLLQVDLTQDTYMKLWQVYAPTMLERSLDNSTVTVTQPNDPSGPFATVDTASQEPTQHEAGIQLHDGPLNSDASQIALPSSGKVKIVGGSQQAFADVATITESGRMAVGAVFSPTSNSIFVTWGAGADSSQSAFLSRYDIETAEMQTVLQRQMALAGEREGHFQPTRMRITPDGSLLFVTVETGINVYAVTP